MPVKLTADLAANLVADILAWPDRKRCGWEEVQGFALARGVNLTRQALSSHVDIKDAWDLKRRHRRGDASEAPANVPDTPVEKLRKEVATLRRTLEACDKRLFRHIHNARARGVTLAQLDEPIPTLET